MQVPAVSLYPQPNSRRLMFVWSDTENVKEEEKRIQIAFEYPRPDGQPAESIIMRRPYCEEWQEAKQRIAARVYKLLAGKKSKKEKTKNAQESESIPSESSTIPVTIDHDLGCATDELTNGRVFFELSASRIFISHLTNATSVSTEPPIEYEVIKDPPTLKEFAVQLLPLVGCPLMPRCKWLIPPPSPPSFHWFATDDESLLHSCDVKSLFDNWTSLHTGDILQLGREHLDKWVAVVVEIKVADSTKSFYSRPFVCTTKVKEVGDGSAKAEFIFEERQRLFCASKSEGSRHRLVSYNVLADLYLKNDLKRVAQEELFFPYCPKEIQAAEYRYPILLRELAGYNADLMFLQEVDQKLGIHYLSKLLPSIGLSHIYRCKSDGLNEGLAIAYDPCRFHLLADRSVYVKDLLPAEQELNKDVKEWLLTADPRLYEYFSSKQTLLQIAHFECVGGREIIAANVHLPSYSPDTESARVAQCLLCMRHLFAETRRITMASGKAPLVLFAGDFNAEPQDQISQLMLNGRLDGAPPIFCSERGSGEKDQLVDSPTFKFKTLAAYPEYTNFTKPEGRSGFVGCLDYIWACPELPAEVVPMPRHELVTRYGALPSEIAPSDHLPVICEVQL